MGLSAYLVHCTTQNTLVNRTNLCLQCDNCIKFKSYLKRSYITHLVRREVYHRDNYTCVSCGKSKADTPLTIHHILPLSKGGTSDIDNLQVLCIYCHREKHKE